MQRLPKNSFRLQKKTKTKKRKSSHSTTMDKCGLLFATDKRNFLITNPLDLYRNSALACYLYPT